jgi:metal-sulfur cluster biosynthetic enzyme
MTASALDESIRAILDAVQDPCSVAAGRPHGLIEMGLVLGWTMKGNHLAIDMCLTAGDCMMAPHFIEAAKAELLKEPDIASVEVVIDHDFLWAPNRMKRGSTALQRSDIVPFALRQKTALQEVAASAMKDA